MLQCGGWRTHAERRSAGYGKTRRQTMKALPVSDGHRSGLGWLPSVELHRGGVERLSTPASPSLQHPLHQSLPPMAHVGLIVIISSSRFQPLQQALRTISSSFLCISFETIAITIISSVHRGDYHPRRRHTRRQRRKQFLNAAVSLW